MKNVFVGNINFKTTEADLKAAFEAFGEVARVRIIMDPYTSRSRGFGFVEMASEQEAATAIAALNGKELDGRPLNVGEARPKPARVTAPVGESERYSQFYRSSRY